MKGCILLIACLSIISCGLKGQDVKKFSFGLGATVNFEDNGGINANAGYILNRNNTLLLQYYVTWKYNLPIDYFVKNPNNGSEIIDTARFGLFNRFTDCISLLYAFEIMAIYRVSLSLYAGQSVYATGHQLSTYETEKWEWYPEVHKQLNKTQFLAMLSSGLSLNYNFSKSLAFQWGCLFMETVNYNTGKKPINRINLETLNGKIESLSVKRQSTVPSHFWFNLNFKFGNKM